MAILSGRTGSVAIGAATGIPATNITVNSKSELVDTTNFTNAGFDSHVIGMCSAEITLDVLAVVGGYGFAVGQTGTVTIDDGSDADNLVTITNCVMTAISYEAAAKDVQKMNITLQTFGAHSVIVG